MNPRDMTDAAALALGLVFVVVIVAVLAMVFVVMWPKGGRRMPADDRAYWRKKAQERRQARAAEVFRCGCCQRPLTAGEGHTAIQDVITGMRAAQGPEAVRLPVLMCAPCYRDMLGEEGAPSVVPFGPRSQPADRP